MNHHKLQLLLSAFVDDELLADERAEVEQHLVHCSECRQSVVEMQTIRQDIRRAATVDITPIATSNLLRAIRLASEPQVVWGGTEIFARRLKADRVVRIDAGHQAMTSRPHALAEIILRETARS